MCKTPKLFCNFSRSTLYQDLLLGLNHIATQNPKMAKHAALLCEQLQIIWPVSQPHRCSYALACAMLCLSLALLSGCQRARHNVHEIHFGHDLL